jgi:SAM-dependent methyltransferase
MRICLECGGEVGSGWRCPACGYQPEQPWGYPRFATGNAFRTDVMGDDNYENLAVLEDKSFWFRSRNRLVQWALARYFRDATSFLEVGCGSGYVLAGIADNNPNLRLVAAEMFDRGLEIARRRVPTAEFLQADAERLPYRDEFDVIGAFDVLEHIDNDVEALAEFRQALSPGGGLLLTVPQHPILWHALDDYSQHKRRYRRREMTNKLAAAGFEVIRTTSFVSLLLPAAFVSRRLKRDPTHFDPCSEFRNSPSLDRLLQSAMDIERLTIRWGVDWPLGLSLLVIARSV